VVSSSCAATREKLLSLHPGKSGRRPRAEEEERELKREGKHRIYRPDPLKVMIARHRLINKPI
jgi:hypothetical protein